MLFSGVGLLLRVIVIMVPTWLRIPLVARIVTLHLPKLERHRKRLQRREMKVLEEQTRARAH